MGVGPFFGVAIGVLVLAIVYGVVPNGNTLCASDAEVAHRYEAGPSGFPEYLNLTPDGRFGFKTSRCFAQTYGKGRWTREGATLVLTSDPDMSAANGPAATLRLVPVTRGNKLYLVAEDYLPNINFASTLSRPGDDPRNLLANLRFPPLEIDERLLRRPDQPLILARDMAGGR